MCSIHQAFKILLIALLVLITLLRKIHLKLLQEPDYG